MFANILAAALRNLGRNRLYAAISIGGLAIGMAAALLTGLFIRDELTFDRFIPGYRDVYVLVSQVRPAGRPQMVLDYAPEQTAGWLKSMLGRTKVARLAFDRLLIRRGAVEASEDVAWVDADFFAVLPLPTAYGDLATAMARPDAVVLTQAMARKLFGQEDVVGQALQLGSQSMRVAAVIRDLPDDTHLTQRVFASGAGGASLLRRLETQTFQQGFTNIVTNPPPAPGPIIQPVRTRIYVRLQAGAPATALQKALVDMTAQHAQQLAPSPTTAATILAAPLSGLHLYPFTGSLVGAAEARGSTGALYAMGGVAALILLIAGINFVNLMTARAVRRAAEVGVRKAAGARRRDLIVQFIGEATLYAALAMIVGLALAELCLPGLNAILLRDIDFAYWRSPVAPLWLGGAVFVVGGLAGAYPALVLSAFRPAAVLRGVEAHSSDSGAVR
jgi:putative ABC transport system permease protein